MLTMFNLRKHKRLMTDTLSISPLYDKQPCGQNIMPKCTPGNVTKEEDNHELRVPKKTKGRAGSIYKHQYIDEQGGVIVIKAAEVSLHIPPGALSKRTFISIEVKSVANCDINGLDTSTSLTPIVSCKPDGLIFEKTVELILPHCAEFDDICLHKATARFVEGHINVSTDSTNSQDKVRCVLKERYCHVYTTHFSDVVVGISNCLKKRMLVVPFSGGSTKLYVKVWIINDLPSEYTILLQEQMELKFVPFNQTGKFILENHGKCSLKVQSCVDDKKLTEVSKDIDIKQLFRNVRSAHDFEIEKTVTNASQKFVTVSFLKEPVFCLQKEIQDGDVVGSIQKENCAFDVIETQDGEVAQTQTGPDDIIQQIFTYQTDIFKAIGEFCTDVSKSIWNIGFRYRQHEHKSDLFTTVTSLQPVIFKKISSFSEDIFWKLSPDERELIKAISSFNTDILERVSTAQTEMYAVLQRGGDYPWHTSSRDAYSTVISLHTEIFERISTFIEGTLQMPPLMQADLLHKVKTLELAIFGRIEALPEDLSEHSYYFLEEFMWNEYHPEFSSKMEKFSTELFQRVSSFYEDFLRLSPMGLDDIANKVTVLVQDLLKGTSSFFKDIAPVLCSAYEDDFLRPRFTHHQDFTTMINSAHRGLFTDVSSFVKGLQDLMPSFGEDLFKQMSSLEKDVLKLVSSLEKDLPKRPSLTKRARRKKFAHFTEDPLPKSLKFTTDSGESSSFSVTDPLTKPIKSSNEPHKSWSYFMKDSDESSSYSSKDPLTKPFKFSNEPPKSWSYFKKGGKEESSKPPESKRAAAN